MINKIVFLVSSLSQPRAIRRVESIAALGYKVKVYGYDRGQYNCNKFSEGIDVTILGQLGKGGGYLAKVKQIKKDVNNIVNQHKSDNTLFYSFGYIETFFLYMSKVRYAYEISDIVYSWGMMSEIRPLLKAIDKKMIRKSEFTLLTSEGFKNFLKVNDARIIFQPNKVNRKLLGCQRKTLQKIKDNFVFSFIGSIRDEPILRFARVIGELFPQHEFHFYGVSNTESTKMELECLLDKYPNIKFFGPFKNPDDLVQIYNSVDIVVTTYGLTLNETILDPNKLYEGILFCRPLVATQGTFLAKQINRYCCGWNIDSSTENSIREFVAELTADKVNKVSANEKLIDDEFAFDNMEKLARIIKSL